METNELLKPNLSCFKCHPQLMGPLNIDYNASSSTFILWNKYEIYLYENFLFDSSSRIFLPEFQICHLISSNNLIVCLDFCGNIHTTSMKFKQSTNKRMKTNFWHREQDVLKFALSTNEKLLCLKLEHDAYYLCLHILNAEFQLDKKVKLNFSTEYNHQYSNNSNLHILKSHKFMKLCEDALKIFDIKKDVWNEYFFIVISFDKRDLYGCALSPKMPVNEISLQKLYTSPMEICDVKVNETDFVSILISLTGGTLIRLGLNEDRTTDIVHLNTAIFKCLPYNNAIIYTDGITMWKCENTFRPDIKFQQFVVKQIKDLVCFGDQVLCTTYNYLVYLFCLDDDSSYIQTSPNEYCEVGKVLNDSSHLSKILEEIELNHKIEDKIKEENDYMSALSVANRSDLLENILQYSIKVYEGYEDIMKESIDITLTNDIKEYFSSYLFYLLIKITVMFENLKVRDSLLKVLRDLQIHITLLSGNKVLKSTSIRVFDELKSINILIPLDGKVVDSTVKVNIKLVKRIPGGLYKEQVMWPILHFKEINLNSEHFIKSRIKKHNIIQLKEPENSIEDAIYQIASNNNKHLFTFTNTTYLRQNDEFSYHVKLPHNFTKAFKNIAFYEEIFNSEKAASILQRNTSEDFLKAKNNITFEIGNTKVKVEIVNDGITNTNLKVTSDNLKIGFDLRNFYSNLAYNNFEACETGKTFEGYTLYTIIDNLHKSIKQCITRKFQDEDLKIILERFQTDVFGALPI